MSPTRSCVLARSDRRSSEEHVEAHLGGERGSVGDKHREEDAREDDRDELDVVRHPLEGGPE